MYTMPKIATVASAVVEWSIGLCINLFILCRMFILLLDKFIILFIAVGSFTVYNVIRFKCFYLLMCG